MSLNLIEEVVEEDWFGGKGGEDSVSLGRFSCCCVLLDQVFSEYLFRESSAKSCLALIFKYFSSITDHGL